jgi:hypothetical protein
MNFNNFFKYLGIFLVLFSISIGFMIDCNYFDYETINIPVLTSFISFIIGIMCLSYSKDKTK